MYNCGKTKLMREGNAFYELDEECLKRGLNRQKEEIIRENEEKERYRKVRGREIRGYER